MQGAANDERQTSLDLLEEEDYRILGLWDELGTTSGTAVQERARAGNLEKLLVRHFATREAALVDVADGLHKVPDLSGLTPQFVRDMIERRRRMDAVERMTRGIPGIQLNAGQDFDATLVSFLEMLRPELEWDLREGIPEVRRQLDAGRRARVFHDADYVVKHAPVHVSTSGPKWWERFPVVSRALTILGHLRDYPKASRDART